jgi:peptidoglycan/LPS O-acetylase OafA/YrhL
MSEKIPALTGIRGIAACWVVLYHIWNLGGPAPAPAFRPDLPLFEAGWVGVDLFFILSGFILMHAHMPDFAGSAIRHARSFYGSRVLRIYPLSAVVLALIVALVAVDRGFAQAYVAEARGNLSLVGFVKTLTLSTRWLLPGHGEWNEPIWSLSVEMLGYLAFPPLAWLLFRVTTAWVAAVIVAACLFGLLWYLARLGAIGINLAFSHESIIRMAAEFAAGMALYRFRATLPRPPSPRLANAVALLAVALTAVAAVVPLGTAAMPFLFSVLILALSFNPGGIVDRFIGSRAIVYLGRISFPLYLVHIMPLRAMNFHANQIALPYPALVAIYFVAMLALASALHRFVERPANALAHRAAKTGPRAEQLHTGTA